LQRLARKRNKTISFIEFMCPFVLGIDKHTDQAGLLCDYDGPVDRFREQQAAIALSLVFSGNSKSRQANGRKSMVRIFLGIGRWKMLRPNFTERECKIA